MADLEQVVGALLRDLAKSRFAADIYSRSISRYYEQDFLLRRFPIPRTEIEEAEIELKFAIEGVAASLANTEGREATLAPMFERSIERVVTLFLSFLVPRVAAREDIESRMANPVNRNVFRIDLRQAGLRYMIVNFTELISDEGAFDVKAAAQGLTDAFQGVLLRNAVDGDEITNDEAASLTGGIDVTPPLEDLRKRIADVWTVDRDARLDVTIGADALRELPAEILSTVKIKAAVRNYQWTEVKVEGGRTYRSMTSE
ncbi:MAG: hypothetical protein AAF414_03250 [Pseudomonadota bacterium]